MSKSNGDLLGGFQPESEFPDIPNAAAFGIPDAGISMAEMQDSGMPLEWYEAVAMTQGLCETLSKWGDQMGRMRIQADSVFINAAGEVNVTGKRSGGPRPAKLAEQVADLLRSLLTDKAIPTPLRLALTQASASSSLEEWSKSVAYYERPNRVDLIKAVYERAVNRAASVAPHVRQIEPAALEVDVAPVASRPTAVAPAALRLKLPKLDSRYAFAAAAVVGIPALIIVFVWLILPMANSSLRRSNAAGTPSATGESAAAAIEPSANAPAGSIRLQPALPPQSQRLRTSPGSPTQPRPELPAAAGPIPETSVPLASPTTVTPDRPGLSRGAPDPTALSLSSVIYSEDDPDVVPPVAVYPQFPKSLPPGVGPNDVAEFYVFVSETGNVESVRARRVPETMAEAMRVTMSLSAAKSWRFKPGMKNGQPVRYRALVWVLKN